MQLVPSCKSSDWLDHVYRMFFYDAQPYDGSPFNPISWKQVNFDRTAEAAFRRGLFDLLRKQRKFALRLGTLKAERTWTPFDANMKSLLKFYHRVDEIDSILSQQVSLEDVDLVSLREALAPWREITPIQFIFRSARKEWI